MPLTSGSTSPPPGMRSAALAGSSRLARRWRVRLLLHRRPVAAACAGVAVWAMLQVLSPAPTPQVPVLVAARSLPSGTVLGPDDLVEVGFAPGSVPDAVADSPTGRTLASPVTRGEPVTDARLVSPGLAEHLDGRVAVPLRLPDAEVARLLRVGDSVDLVATDPRAGSHRELARDVVVLALPTAGATGNSGAGGGASAPAGTDGHLLLVGVHPDRASDVAAAAATDLVQVLWRAAARPNGGGETRHRDPRD